MQKSQLTKYYPNIHVIDHVIKLIDIMKNHIYWMWPTLPYMMLIN